MSPLSDEYLRSLEPETMRYDVTIFDDFVISVLPNGIKTWAFLYDYEGRKRRKTLGVYPDMSYEEAEDALDNARAMILKLGDEIKDSPVEPDVRTVAMPEEAIVATPPPAPEQRPAVLASRKRYHTRPRKSSFRGKRYFALGILSVLVLAAAVIIVPRLGGGGTTTSAAPAEQTIPGRAQPKPIVIESEPVAPTSTPGRAAPKPILLDDTSASTSTPLPVPTPVAAPAPSVSETPTPTPTPTAPAPDPISETEPEPEPELIVAAAPVKPEPAFEPAPEPEPEPEPEPAPEAEPERVAAVVPPATTSAAPATRAPVDTEATSTGGEVSRAIVTSNVADLEPVDNLGANITLTDGGYQTVFFFTELRNFTPGNIVHRWIYNGRVIADVPLKVAGGWRWRTYSSKDLLPGMTGDWTVAVIDGDGRTLGEQNFRFDR